MNIEGKEYKNKRLTMKSTEIGNLKTPNIKIIGISGVSGNIWYLSNFEIFFSKGSERHGIARTTSKKLNSPFEPLLLTDYYRKNISNHKKYEKNFEIPESLDFDLLKKHIKILIDFINLNPYQKFPNLISTNYKKNLNLNSFSYKSNKTEDTIYIIVEGFLLFFDKDLCNFFDLKIFLDSDKEKCFKKKLKSIEISKEYFDEMIWFYYQKYKNIQLKNSKPIHLEGNETSEKFYNNLEIIIKEYFEIWIIWQFWLIEIFFEKSNKLWWRTGDYCKLNWNYEPFGPGSNFFACERWFEPKSSKPYKSKN